MAYSNSPLATYKLISPYKNSPRNKPISKITIHHMAGNLTIEQCGRVFQSSQSSANYGIGSDGRIGLYVDERDRTWASSSAENDNIAVTIEVANSSTGGQWPVSDKALESLINLCTDICKRNGIAQLNYTGTTSGNLTRHNMFAATTCPGTYLQSKFPWIAGQVNLELSKAKGDITMAQYEELKKMIDDNYRWISATMAEMREHTQKVDARLKKMEDAENVRKTAKCPNWAKDSVQLAIDKGVLTGDGTAKPNVDNVRPRDYLTRAEMAVMQERYDAAK